MHRLRPLCRTLPGGLHRNASAGPNPGGLALGRAPFPGREPARPEIPRYPRLRPLQQQGKPRRMRKIWDIPGGIHPPENKTQSLQTAVAVPPMPEQLVLPLIQHAGTAARPVVDAGDQVLKGQLLAEPGGAVSAAIHAPTSGLISAIEDRPVPHPSGMSARCIILIPDGRDQWCARRGLDDYRGASPTALLDRIRDAGIAG